ncbi:MAG: DUF4325 domain-containing protein [Candidatus Kaelpia aquatica]|nr:DUF4325 domain-containing protein [Candidatus Kaelpia aquatica]
MSVKDTILSRLKQNSYVTTEDIVKSTGLTRQGVHKHIKELVSKGVVKKIGNTKGVKYTLRDKRIDDLTIKLEKSYLLHNLKEDLVFNKINIQYDLKHQLRKNIFDVLSYAFTELLNNAIDHSQSKKSKIKLKIDNYNIDLSINDWGIGIFKNIKDKFDLKDEYEALQELIKGKTTTAEQHHSGEGLFFTSKASDKLIIKSHDIEITFDNIKNDLFTKKIKYKQGTLVNFKISKNSKKRLKTIFDDYGNEEYDYEFSKTSVTVNLFTRAKDSYVSRSEAKRLLHNLDRFKEIALNFKDVKGIGQGFADEIFRVFKNKNLNIKIQTLNANKTIKSMIQHVG